jgi:hypothetical protein
MGNQLCDHAVMNAPDHSETTGKRVCYRPVGAVSLDEAVDLVSMAIVYTRERGASELLANISGLIGFPPPSLGNRYLLIGKWAATAGGTVRLAVVARAEMIHRQKFGVAAAASLGLTGNIFETEAEALAWLNGNPSPKTSRQNA